MGAKRDRRDKREASVARGIGRIIRSQLFRVLLAADVLMLLIASLFWCYDKESAYSGLTNPAEMKDAVTRYFSRVTDVDGDWHFTYTVSMPGKARATYDFTTFFSYALLAFLAVFFVELQFLWIEGLANISRIRRELRPLNALAEEAQRFSRMPLDATGEPYAERAGGGIPVEKFHSLEHAIEGFNPEAAGERLYTGDRALVGLEEAINDLIARMREAYRQQTRFVDDASHELRTPIAVVKGYADMLSRWGKDDPKVLMESISAIQTETAHMSRLVEQLLFLARGDSGRTQLVMERLDLAAILREVYEESCMIHPDHVWHCEAPRPVPVRADAAMLKQAARILVDNAVKYTGPGETIRLRAYKNTRGDAVIEVQDSGIGISKSELPHVFERFYRADPARAAGTGGSGLGLAIAKWIVDRHGGYFDVVSLQNVGTRIAICLPEQGQTAETPQG